MAWEPAISPSAISAFDENQDGGCQRKWGFRSLVRQEYKQDIGAFRGESVHAILEAYGWLRVPPVNHQAGIVAALKAKYATDLAEKKISAEDYADRIVAVAHKMIPLAPEPPWVPTGIEQKIKFRVDGVLWTGRIDLEYDNVVHDHKVTSSRDFIKTPDILATDVQAQAYSYWHFQRKKSPVVRLHWLYGMPGAKPSAKLVEAEIKPLHAFEQMHDVFNPIAKQIRSLYLTNPRPNPLDLKPNFKSCPKFNGCPYQDICKPTAAELMSAYVTEESLNHGSTSRPQGQRTIDDNAPARTDPRPAQ